MESTAESTPDPPPVELVDVSALLADAARNPQPRVRWSASNQLQTNLVVLQPGEAVDEHVERELDVTLVVVSGSVELSHGPAGQVTRSQLSAASVVVLPAGTRRSLRAGPDGAAYLTAHRRRASLLPKLR